MQAWMQATSPAAMGQGSMQRREQHQWESHDIESLSPYGSRQHAIRHRTHNTVTHGSPGGRFEAAACLRSRLPRALCGVHSGLGRAIDRKAGSVACTHTPSRADMLSPLHASAINEYYNSLPSLSKDCVRRAGPAPAGVPAWCSPGHGRPSSAPEGGLPPWPSPAAAISTSALWAIAVKQKYAVSNRRGALQSRP